MRADSLLAAVLAVFAIPASADTWHSWFSVDGSTSTHSRSMVYTGNELHAFHVKGSDTRDCYWTGSSFSCATVATSVGANGIAVVDNGGTLHVIHAQSGNMTGHYWNGSSYVSSGTLASGNVPNQEPSLIVDGSGTVNAFFIQNGGLVRATWNGSSWSTSILAGNGCNVSGCNSSFTVGARTGVGAVNLTPSVSAIYNDNIEVWFTSTDGAIRIVQLVSGSWQLSGSGYSDGPLSEAVETSGQAGSRSRVYGGYYGGVVGGLAFVNEAYWNGSAYTSRDVWSSEGNEADNFYAVYRLSAVPAGSGIELYFHHRAWKLAPFSSYEGTSVCHDASAAGAGVCGTGNSTDHWFSGMRLPSAVFWGGTMNLFAADSGSNLKQNWSN